jgi:hypothetical protein
MTFDPVHDKPVFHRDDVADGIESRHGGLWVRFADDDVVDSVFGDDRAPAIVGGVGRQQFLRVRVALE